MKYLGEANTIRKLIDNQIIRTITLYGMKRELLGQYYEIQNASTLMISCRLRHKRRFLIKMSIINPKYFIKYRNTLCHFPPKSDDFTDFCEGKMTTDKIFFKKF